MSAVLTHLAVGALFGLFGVVLLRREDGPPADAIDAGLVIAVSAALGAFADFDVLTPLHRALLTNVFVLVVAPAVVASAVLATPLAEYAFVRALAPVAPAALGSHLILDLFGFTSREAAILWPLSGRLFGTPPIGPDPHAWGGVWGVDAGTPIFLALLAFSVSAWFVARLGAELRDGPYQTQLAERVAYALVSVAPWFAAPALFFVVGWLRPV